MVGGLTSATFAQDSRTEVDLLGEIEIPADAYYGAQAARAMENFQVSGQYINDYPDFMKAWGMIKLACARANTDAGKMSGDMLKLIEPACQELIDGNYVDQFKIDLYQGGAGTSTNMNDNEVIANIALEKAGYKLGEYDKISPNDELNMGGTAIGTGLNTPEGYNIYVIEHLKGITGYDFVNADDMIAATSSLHSFVVYSSALKTLATTLSKISNDLIILSAGPRNGVFEINLPPRQPGSSIMPGKVNPVIPELMALVSYRVIGHDLAEALFLQAI